MVTVKGCVPDATVNGACISVLGTVTVQVPVVAGIPCARKPRLCHDESYWKFETGESLAITTA